MQVSEGHPARNAGAQRPAARHVAAHRRAARRHCGRPSRPGAGESSERSPRLCNARVASRGRYTSAAVSPPAKGISDRRCYAAARTVLCWAKQGLRRCGHDACRWLPAASGASPWRSSWRWSSPASPPGTAFRLRTERSELRRVTRWQWPAGIFTVRSCSCCWARRRTRGLAGGCKSALSGDGRCVVQQDDVPRSRRAVISRRFPVTRPVPATKGRCSSRQAERVPRCVAAQRRGHQPATQ